MEDIMAPAQTTPTTTGHTHTTATTHSRSKRPPNKVKSSQSKSKMEIHMSGDKSVVMEFNSDSDDDDEDDNILRDLMSHHRPRQNLSREGGGGGRKRKDMLSPTRKSMKQSGSDHGSIFSESDEDFCVIDAPTITKVVSTIVCIMCTQLLALPKYYTKCIYWAYTCMYIHVHVHVHVKEHVWDCLTLKGCVTTCMKCIVLHVHALTYPGSWGQATSQVSAGKGRENWTHWKPLLNPSKPVHVRVHVHVHVMLLLFNCPLLSSTCTYIHVCIYRSISTMVCMYCYFCTCAILHVFVCCVIIMENITTCGCLGSGWDSVYSL